MFSVYMTFVCYSRFNDFGFFPSNPTLFIARRERVDDYTVQPPRLIIYNNNIAIFCR